MNIVLGVTGSISAYRAVEIMRLFQKKGHTVSVVLTEHAGHFIRPLTFAAFAPGRVHGKWFAEGQDPLLHISLSRENDLLLIAPATANIIGKMAAGIADDLLSSLFLAFDNRVVIAPAMNSAMFENPAVQNNLAVLESRKIDIIAPAEGELACRTAGRGRLAEPAAIVDYCLGIEHV